MTEAPERIWAWTRDDNTDAKQYYCQWEAYPCHWMGRDAAEYIRADVAASDAKLAVAMAVQKAADGLLECSVWCDSQERTDASWRNGVTDARKHHMARILATADTDALAEVQALKADLATGQRDYCDLMVRHDAHFTAWQSAKARAEAAEAEVARLTDALSIAGPIALEDFADHPLCYNEEERRKIAIIRAALKGDAG
jgi:acetyl-CoA acetyltransferase